VSKLIKIFRAIAGILPLLALLAGCGTDGTGDSSTYVSINLVVANGSVQGSVLTANSGDVIVGLVTVTSGNSNPVNNITVRVMSSNNDIIADATGKTDINGKASIVLPVKYFSSDREVRLVAGADGLTQSNVPVSVTVTAPKLTATIPGASTYAVTGGTPGSIVRVVLQGTNIKFVNGTSPISNHTVSLYIDSITNKAVDDRVIFSPVQGQEITSPPGILNMTTDSQGIANIPMAVEVVVPSAGSQHVITLNWRAVSTYKDFVFTQSGQSMFTITNS
jgi:hypothetical protein